MTEPLFKLDEQDVRRSKFISRVLRHRAKGMGMHVDRQGWVKTQDLLAKAAESGITMSIADLRRVVAGNDKQRFSFSPDETLIRANQGHSMDVDLDLPVKKPPPVLYHGTVGKFMDAIRKQGLLPKDRHNVHLSATRETAIDVASRRGKPIVLVIETFPMVRDGFQFKVSANGVWLVDRVPPQYLRFPD